MIEHGLVNLRAVHPLAAEAREQRGMDIHDSTMIPLGQLQQTQPTGETDEIDPGFVDQFEDTLTE